FGDADSRAIHLSLEGGVVLAELSLERSLGEAQRLRDGGKRSIVPEPRLEQRAQIAEQRRRARGPLFFRRDLLQDRIALTEPFDGTSPVVEDLDGIGRRRHPEEAGSNRAEEAVGTNDGELGDRAPEGLVLFADITLDHREAAWVGRFDAPC